MKGSRTGRVGGGGGGGGGGRAMFVLGVAYCLVKLSRMGECAAVGWEAAGHTRGAWGEDRRGVCVRVLEDCSPGSVCCLYVWMCV